MPTPPPSGDDETAGSYVQPSLSAAGDRARAEEATKVEGEGSQIQVCGWWIERSRVYFCVLRVRIANLLCKEEGGDVLFTVSSITVAIGTPVYFDMRKLSYLTDVLWLM